MAQLFPCHQACIDALTKNQELRAVNRSNYAASVAQYKGALLKLQELRRLYVANFDDPLAYLNRGVSVMFSVQFLIEFDKLFTEVNLAKAQLLSVSSEYDMQRSLIMGIIADCNKCVGSKL